MGHIVWMHSCQEGSSVSYRESGPGYPENCGSSKLYIAGSRCKAFCAMYFSYLYFTANTDAKDHITLLAYAGVSWDFTVPSYSS